MGGTNLVPKHWPLAVPRFFSYRTTGLAFSELSLVRVPRARFAVCRTRAREYQRVGAPPNERLPLPKGLALVLPAYHTGLPSDPPLKV